MKELVGAFSFILALFLNNAMSQEAKKEEPNSFTIHVRELTKPECVERKSASKLTTVIDAVGSLQPQPTGLSRMGMWIVRFGKDGKPQILPIDWVGITQRGRMSTNFEIRPGDRIILQSRFPK